MNKFLMGLVLLFCFAVSVGCASDQRVVFIYSGNLDGELEPCGCTEQGDLGGISRRATVMAQLRKQYPSLVAVSAGGLLSSESSRDRLKSLYIMKGFIPLQYDAIATQWQDLAYGADFLRQEPLVWVSSNWEGEDFSEQANINRGSVSFSVFAWLDPAQSPFRKMGTSIKKVSDDAKALMSRIRAAKKKGAVTVVATELPLDKARVLLDLASIDVLFVKANYEDYVEPKKVNNTLVLQVGSRGMRVGKLLLTVADGGKIKSWQHDIVPMPNSIADFPGLKGWYEEYNRKVKEAYLARVKIRQAQQQGKSPYTGAQACQACHGQAYGIWEKSKHAQAFTALENVGKAFDPDCIVCHTVGFKNQGGFVDTRSTGDLLNVQCESCHGAGRSHAESGGQKPTGHKAWTKLRICEQCHNRAHSPGFHFEQYWPKIVHGVNREGGDVEGKHR